LPNETKKYLTNAGYPGLTIRVENAPGANINTSMAAHLSRRVELMALMLLFKRARICRRDRLGS